MLYNLPIKRVMQGKEIIEHYLNELQNEGVTYIPTWTEEHPGQAKTSVSSKFSNGSFKDKETNKV